MNVSRLVILLALLATLAGCGPKPATDSKQSPAGKSGGESNSSAASAPSSTEQTPKIAKSNDFLESALYQLRPKNYGVHSNPDKPVSLLNSWRFKRAEELSLSEQAAEVKAPEGWIQKAEEARLSQAKFDNVDAIHIRDALFFHTVAGYVQDRGRDELLFGTNVVDFVCRNISLWKDDEQELPLNPYMTLQLGRGSIEARAWVTACILRQLRIESLIVQAAPTAKDANDKWLLGIPYNGKIYLFDLKLGLPVSGSTEAVASLADIIAQPDLLNQLTAAGSYRITADELKAAEIQVIADATFWSRRMWNVEQDLPASDSCVLYQPPIRTDDQPGLLQLVATKSGIAFDQLKLWPYPHRIQADAQVPSEAKGIQFQRLSAPFAVPIPFKSAGEGKPVEFGLPERKLERFRSAHLMGQFTEASQRYLSIRHLEVERNPPELDRLNRVAAEDAFYWTALCKVELNDHAAAIDLLSGYLKKYDRKGSWYFSARTQLARSQAIAGHTSDAIKTLERSSSDDPYQDLNALLVKRWKASEK